MGLALFAAGCYAPPTVVVRAQTARASRDEQGWSLDARDAATDADASLLVAPARDAGASDRPGGLLVAENLGTVCLGPAVPIAPWAMSEPVNSPRNTAMTRTAAEFMAMDPRSTVVLLVGHSRTTRNSRSDRERAQGFAEAIAAELASHHAPRHRLLPMGLGTRCPYRLPASSQENDVVYFHVVRIDGEDIPLMISCANGRLFQLEANGNVTRLPPEARWRAPRAPQQ